MEFDGDFGSVVATDIEDFKQYVIHTQQYKMWQ